MFNLIMVVMSLCDAYMKNQVESTYEYPDLDKKFDSIGQLNLIKKIVYTGGTNDLNTSHIKVCDSLQLCFGRCKDNARAVPKEKCMTNLMESQLKGQ